jgi:hypothetical protein
LRRSTKWGCCRASLRSLVRFFSCPVDREPVRMRVRRACAASRVLLVLEIKTCCGTTGSVARRSPASTATACSSRRKLWARRRRLQGASEPAERPVTTQLGERTATCRSATGGWWYLGMRVSFWSKPPDLPLSRISRNNVRIHVRALTRPRRAGDPSPSANGSPTRG